MQRISTFLTSHASLIVCLAAALGYFCPSLFLWVEGIRQTLILGFIMLTMGMTLTANDFRILFSRPFDIVIGALAQYTIMPCLAWTVAHVAGFEPSVAVGLILVGCCPGGVSSNLMSYLCRGDVAYSVGMTTISTLLSPVVTPALVALLVGEHVDVNAFGMFVSILLVTLLPISLGFGFNAWAGSKYAEARRTMPSLSVVGLALIVGGVVSHVAPHLAQPGWTFVLLMFCAVFVHNGTGYALGYLVGRLMHFGKAKNRTLSIEVGMQNAGLATNLASVFFVAANPLSVVPCAISCAWHSISGTLIANWFALRDKKVA